MGVSQLWKVKKVSVWMSFEKCTWIINKLIVWYGVWCGVRVCAALICHVDRIKISPRNLTCLYHKL